jgi:CheY-like chemotaxis protein
MVEDNRFNRQIAKTFLSQAHVQVTEAENGAVAVELARHRRFDLILMDIQMPVMDGYAATALLRRQLELTTPIVALTANAINGERDKCLAAGMSGYLSKPFKEEELLKTVSKWTLPPAADPDPDRAPVPVAPPVAAPPAADAPLYAVTELLEIGQGDQEFVTFMLETFVESCEEARLALAEALTLGDVRRLKTVAHTLRPGLKHLCSLHLLPPVEALDQWVGSFELTTLRPLVEIINQLLHELIIQIRLDMRDAAGVVLGA